jgi:hypothetical protein
MQNPSFYLAAFDEANLLSATGAKFDVLANVQHASDAGQTAVHVPTAQESLLENQRAARTKSNERKPHLT